MLVVPAEFEVFESASVIESLVCMEQEFMAKVLKRKFWPWFEEGCQKAGTRYLKFDTIVNY